MDSGTIAKKFYKDLGVQKFKNTAKKFRVDDDIVFVKKYSKKTDLILDLACGYGRIAIPLAKSGFRVTGIDISNNLIFEARRSARRMGAKVDFDTGDMRKLPYPDKSFDKIFCMWNSFNDLLTRQDQVKTLNEIYRILKPKGRAFMVLLNGEDRGLQKELRENGIGKEKRIWKDLLQGVVFHMYVHDRSSVKSLCRKSQFKKCKISLRRMNGRKRILVELEK